MREGIERNWNGELARSGEESELTELEMKLNCGEKRMNLVQQSQFWSLCQMREINGAIRGKLGEWGETRKATRPWILMLCGGAGHENWLCEGNFVHKNSWVS